MPENFSLRQAEGVALKAFGKPFPMFKLPGLGVCLPRWITSRETLPDESDKFEHLIVKSGREQTARDRRTGHPGAWGRAGTQYS
jgi:hypothetical protein